MAILACRLHDLSRHSSPRQEDIHLEYEVVRAITFILNHRVSLVFNFPVPFADCFVSTSPPPGLRWPAIRRRRSIILHPRLPFGTFPPVGWC